MGFDRWDNVSKCRNHRFHIQLFHSNRNKSNRREERAHRRCQARGEFSMFDSVKWHELLMALKEFFSFWFALSHSPSCSSSSSSECLAIKLRRRENNKSTVRVGNSSFMPAEGLYRINNQNATKSLKILSKLPSLYSQFSETIEKHP